MERISAKTRKITLMGILLAMVVVLSFVERLIPPLPFLPPNVRLGLSNVIVMYTMFFLGTKYAYTMALLKSLFVMLMRGATAAFLSLCGGLCSVTIIALFGWIFRNHISYLILSILGAIAHNIGQMFGASYILKTDMVKMYFPILLIAGVLFGSVTGMLLKVVMPAFDRISGLSPATKGAEQEKEKK